MQTLSPEAVVRFQEIVGERNVRQSENDLEHMGKDWSTVPNPNPATILLPICTDEVSKILSYCNEHNIKVVPSGGRTGLVGGAMAVNGEVVLSLRGCQHTGAARSSRKARRNVRTRSRLCRQFAHRRQHLHQCRGQKIHPQRRHAPTSAWT